MNNSQRFWRGLFIIFFIAALCGGLALPIAEGIPAHAAPRMQIVTHVVISQVYGGGGVSGATYLNDYVELFNPSNTDISLNGMSIQYASAAGADLFSANVTNLSGTLVAGHFYLVQLASNAVGEGNSLPKADVIGSTDIAQNNGKVVLANTTTGLPCNGGLTPCDAAATASIIDLVGYGSANFFEGTDTAPAINNTTADLRNNNGCSDTDDNNIDFAADAPTPRNTGVSPVLTCSDRTATASAVNATATASAVNATNTVVAFHRTETAIANLSNTPTPSRTPTNTRTPTRVPTKVRTRTPTPAPPPPLVAINEFVPRPGHDWNHDGQVNTGDEYIELLNHGVIDVNLSGYSLDDEVNIGSSPFRLPSTVLKPGERIVFFGSQTGLLLSDGGDAVRLLKPNGQLGDAYNYSVVRFPDESFCRLPDNGGLDDWNQFCFPTPGLPNSQSESSVNPPTTGQEDLSCPISDTLPQDFMFAECLPTGSNIWNPAYWDRNGWFGEQYLPGSPSKWPLFAN